MKLGETLVLLGIFVVLPTIMEGTSEPVGGCL